MTVLDPCPRLFMRENEEFGAIDGIEHASSDIVGRQTCGLPGLSAPGRS